MVKRGVVLRGENYGAQRLSPNNNVFQPNVDLTREQACQMAYNALKASMVQ